MYSIYHFLYDDDKGKEGHNGKNNYFLMYLNCVFLFIQKKFNIVIWYPFYFLWKVKA